MLLGGTLIAISVVACNRELRAVTATACTVLSDLSKSLEDSLGTLLAPLRQACAQVQPQSGAAFATSLLKLAGAAVVSVGEYFILAQTFAIVLPDEALAGRMALTGVVLTACLGLSVHKNSGGRAVVLLTTGLLVLTQAGLAYQRTLEIEDAQRLQSSIQDGAGASAMGEVVVGGVDEAAIASLDTAEPAPPDSSQWSLRAALTAALALLFVVGHILLLAGAWEEAGKAIPLLFLAPATAAIALPYVALRLINRSGLLALPSAVIAAASGVCESLLAQMSALPARHARACAERALQRHRRKTLEQVLQHRRELTTLYLEFQKKCLGGALDAGLDHFRLASGKELIELTDTGIRQLIACIQNAQDRADAGERFGVLGSPVNGNGHVRDASSEVKTCVN